MKQIFSAQSDTSEYRTFSGYDSDYSYSAEVSGDFSQAQILQLRAIVKKFEVSVRKVIEMNAPTQSAEEKDV